ncbi:Sporozoite surface protein 2 [Senna tora]|uniref:Sporozoite surface protein 2 n=1 Tax=Senna tora TaxID=362788 RepID=A0A834T3K4_9FABA|nr:Sporozoite surface protein 2 [Senna tora]
MLEFRPHYGLLVLTMDCYFIVKVHHGGRFEHIAQLEYVGGESIYWDNCDMDRWSFFEMKGDLDAMGYKGNYDLWYANPNGRLEDQLKPIIDDTQAMDMARVGVVLGQVNLYLCHVPFQLEQILALPSTEPVEEEGKTSEEESSEGEDEKESSEGEDAQSLDDNNEEAAEVGDKEEEVHTSQGGHIVYGSEDSDNESVEDSAVSITFVDSEEEDIGRGFDILAEEHNVFEIETESENQAVSTSKASTSKARGLSDEEYESEQLLSKYSDEDEDDDPIVEKKVFPRFKPINDMTDYKFDLGTIFGSKTEFVDAVKTHAVHNGKSTKFIKNDKQRGLLPSIFELLPNVDQHFCVRHLYNNFRKKFPGQTLKELMWKAAKSTYPAEWEKIMLEMRGVDENAYKHLLAISPRFWSKSRFNTTQHCDALLNNMSETFNSVIVDFREKPILIMLEAIREYLMNIWADYRRKITTHQESVLPRIKARLEKQVDMSRKWIPQWSGDEIFEVTSVYQATDTFVVDLQKNYELHEEDPG